MVQRHQGGDKADQPLSIEEVVHLLYKVILGRQGSEDEVRFHAGATRTGVSIATIATGIYESEEASARQAAELARRLSRSSTVDQASSGHTSVPLDDLMQAVSLAYDVGQNRQPTFQEAHDFSAALRQGTGLADLLRNILFAGKGRVEASGQPHAGREIIAKILEIIYQACLGRPVSFEEVDGWFQTYKDGLSLADVILGINNSEEAKSFRNRRETVSNLTPGAFVQLLFDIVHRRGARASELEQMRSLIERGVTSQPEMLNAAFADEVKKTQASEAAPYNPDVAILFGVKEFVSRERWEQRKRELFNAPQPENGLESRKTFSRFPFVSKACPLVSVIASVYKGGRFIEPFLEMITSQTIFDRHCELIIVDASSPDGEIQKAEPYIRRHSNIVYERQDTRVGIYQAWNIAARLARGAYLTNANVDDSRRLDSLELQAATLDALPNIDIVYQDVFYSFEENMHFEDITRFGFQTNLPIVSRYNLMEFNLPHNAPMWRRRLHDEIGFFDESLTSAGDFEFWVRCAVHGKTFYKLNDAHVAYYVNPEGMSTNPQTRGEEEADLVLKRHAHKLISRNLTMTNTEFAASIEQITGIKCHAESRYEAAQMALRSISAAHRRSPEGRRT